MTRSRHAVLVAGLSLLTAAGANGQVVSTLTAPYAPNAGAVTAFGYYMSPYSGTVDGSVERLNCVDFFHDVTVGQVWLSNVTNLGAASSDLALLANTREGSNGYYSLVNALNVYKEMAWLTDQYSVNPGLNGATAERTVAIQTAIWALGSNSPTEHYTTDAQGSVDKLGGFGPSSDPNSTGYWIQQAQLQYSQQSDDYYNQFNIVTDVNKASSGSAQEFVYATPEPGTFVLIGSGMLGMLGFVTVRRRKEARDGQPNTLAT